MKLNDTLMNCIESMICDLRKIYGELLTEIILYGSYARGTQNDESDIDIALLLNKKPSKYLTDLMIDCVSSYELKCDKVLSVIDIDRDIFNKNGNIIPFYSNIRKEGIVLWKTA